MSVAQSRHKWREPSLGAECRDGESRDVGQGTVREVARDPAGTELLGERIQGRRAGGIEAPQKARQQGVSRGSVEGREKAPKRHEVERQLDDAVLLGPLESL